MTKILIHEEYDSLAQYPPQLWLLYLPIYYRNWAREYQGMLKWTT